MGSFSNHIEQNSYISQSTEGNRLLSIIIPAFNAANHIEDCLNSIVRVLAEVLPEIEVIIKDGGSNDNTLTIVRRFHDKLPLKILEGSDQGIYDAMNIALDIAKGNWVYFIGSDDLLLEDFKFFFEELRSTNASVLYGSVLMKRSARIYDGPFDFEKLCAKNICHQAMAFRIELIKSVGGFSLDFPILADYALNLAIFGNENWEKQYVPFTIAQFAEDGISSQPDPFRDPDFILSKPALLIGAGSLHLSKQTLYQAYIHKAELQLNQNKVYAAGKSIFFGAKQTGRWRAAIRFYLGTLKRKLLT